MQNIPEIVTELAADKPAIDAAIKSLASELAKKLAGKTTESKTLVAVVVLEGARRFASDLLRELAELGLDIQQVEVRAKSYYGGTASCGVVEIETTDINEDALKAILAGAHVLLIDDIYDTGRTITALKEKLLELGADEITTCVLLEKDRPHERPIDIDFIGMKMPDRFLIGYGLDFEEKYRELDYLAFADGLAE